MKMRVIIVGGGRIGKYLAKTLLEEECDVTIVDKKIEVCQEIERELGCDCVQGDATKTVVLDEADVREADSFVSLTSSDETNLLVCMIAKQMGAKNVGARLGALYYDEAILKKFGLDTVIYPEAAAAGYIAELITKPELLDLAFISRGEAEIIEVQVKPHSPISGKRVKDIEYPHDSAIIALFEKGKIIIPEPSTTIRAGDRLLILAKTDVIHEIRQKIV